MEKELFHENLSALHERFGADTVFLSMDAAAKYCKRDRRTLLADRTFPAKKIGKSYHVNVIALARWLA